jgi:prephenate dehydrogenase
MTIGIVGLGLIGGSLARAWKVNTAHTVLGNDRDASVVSFARLCGALDGELTRDAIGECDLIMLALYPEAEVAWLNEHAPYIRKNTTVIDCAGTKKKVCAACFPLAEQYGFRFIGGHPMAGTHHSGFKYSRANMFMGAPMVLVPPVFDDIQLLDEVTQLLRPLGFGRFSVTTAEKHDEMIAFTSQLAHIVSNAYIKSPTAGSHKGFSAGSYKDLTRVAWLNPQMWTELFLENDDCLTRELDVLIENLTQYRTAIANGDREHLCRLLDDGRRRKEEVDG